MIRNNTVGAIIGRSLEDLQPEATDFTNRNGHRGATLIVNAEQESDIPSIAEPWFLNFNADCNFQVVMGPEALQEAGLEELGKKWG